MSSAPKTHVKVERESFSKIHQVKNKAVFLQEAFVLNKHMWTCLPSQLQKFVLISSYDPWCVSACVHACIFDHFHLSYPDYSSPCVTLHLLKITISSSLLLYMYERIYNYYPRSLFSSLCVYVSVCLFFCVHVSADIWEDRNMAFVSLELKLEVVMILSIWMLGEEPGPFYKNRACFRLKSSFHVCKCTFL